MNVITIIEGLLRRWWLLVLFGAGGLAIAYYLAVTAPHRYQSTVSLQLNPSGTSSFLPYQADASAAGPNPIAVQAASYQEVLRSRTFGQVVLQQLNLNMAPEAIAGSISTQLVPDTNILHVSVTWDNPSDAQQLTQRVAEIFIAENQRRQQSQPGVQAQLADLQQSATDMQSRRAPLQQQRDRLDDAVSRGDLSRLNDLTALENRLSELDTSYANLLVEMSRLRTSFDTAVILDTATPARSLDAVPMTQALVFGLLAGLGAAALLSFLLDRLADRVRIPDDVVGASGLAVLGRIRHMPRGLLRRNRSGTGKALITLSAPTSVTTEQFRSLRTAMMLSMPTQDQQVVVVTGVEKDSGTTFVAANLAIVLAQSGRRVLLVDGNLRKPALHAAFGTANTPGLTDLLRLAGVDPSLASANGSGVVGSGIPNLGLLPAGESPPDTGELLRSDYVARAFDHLSKHWETVIVDSADLAQVSDTLVLAHEASACVVVARAARTRRATLLDAAAALDSISAHVLGVVLNDERGRPLGRFARYGSNRIGFALVPDEMAPGQLPRGTAHMSTESWRD